MCCKRRAGVSACLLALTALSTVVLAQEAVNSKQSQGSDSRQVEQLQEQLTETRERLSQSEAKLRELSSVVESLQRQMASLQPAPSASSPAPQGAGEQGAQAAKIGDDEWQLLNAKVEEHQQTKVESVSKFRLKLSGMFLLNIFGNSGTVDEIDLPRVAYPRPPAASDGAFGA